MATPRLLEVPAAALCDALPPWPTFDQLSNAGFVAEARAPAHRNTESNAPPQGHTARSHRTGERRNSRIHRSQISLPPPQGESGGVVALGLFLAAASVLSLLPQLGKIVVRRSSEGVSALSLSCSAIADVLQLASVLASASPRFLACRSISPGLCFVGALPSVQGVAQAAGSLSVLAAFAYFWVRPGGQAACQAKTEALLEPLTATLLVSEAPVAAAPPRGQVLGLVAVLGLSMVALLASLLLPLVAGPCAAPVGYAAWLTALVSVQLSLVGGLPQIYLLARTCVVGSVSSRPRRVKLC